MGREGRQALATWSPFEFSRADRRFGTECLGRALICCHNSFFPLSLRKAPWKIGGAVVRWRVWKDSSGGQRTAAAGTLAKLTKLTAPPSEAAAPPAVLSQFRPWST